MRFTVEQDSLERCGDHGDRPAHDPFGCGGRASQPDPVDPFSVISTQCRDRNRRSGPRRSAGSPAHAFDHCTLCGTAAAPRCLTAPRQTSFCRHRRCTYCRRPRLFLATELPSDRPAPEALQLRLDVHGRRRTRGRSMVNAILGIPMRKIHGRWAARCRCGGIRINRLRTRDFSAIVFFPRRLRSTCSVDDGWLCRQSG